MKTNFEALTYIVKNNQIKNLIKAALDIREAEELTELFDDVCKELGIFDDAEVHKNAILYQGYALIKIKTLEHETKLKEFIKAEIYPNVNEFDNNCTF